MDRLIRIFVRDCHRRPLPGSTVKFYLDDSPVGEIQDSEGSASLQVAQSGTIKVEVTYPGQHPQSEVLGAGQDDFTFQFNVRGGFSPMKKDILAALLGAAIVAGLILLAFYLGILAGVLPLALGVVLLVIALVLAFTFGTPTLLQAQLIRSTFALAAGALATQIPGLLNVNLSIGTQAAITAGGAIGVYIITFFFTPARDANGG